MNVTDDQRIDDLERLARSLAMRVDRLEHRSIPGRLPVVSPPADGGLGTASRTAPAPVRAAAGHGPPSTPTRDRPSDPAAAKAVLASHERFEDLLGGRMLAWLGGIAVVVGIVLFFAYAISRGWIGESARVLGGGVVSLALLCLGVWLHEHRGRTDAARTVVAVAVAGLFITVVVASRVYAVIPTAAGVALALAAGAAGAVLAIRWDAKVIGAIGIIGALLAPVMVGAPTDSATLVVLLSTALSAVAVLLWRRWDWLAFAVVLVCAPQWLYWLLWLDHGPGLASALAVLISFGALGLVAAIGFELRLPEAAPRPPSCLLLALNALVLAIAGYSLLTDHGHVYAAGLWIAALGAAHVALALLGGRLRRISAETKLLLLTLGVLLGDVAFALLSHGAVLAVGWAATSVLFAGFAALKARRGNDPAIAGLGLGAHLAGALLVAVSQATPAGVLAYGTGDRVAATIALAAVAAAAFTSARLSSTASQPWRGALDAVALGVLAYLSAINLQGAELVVAWAMEAVVLAKVARRTSDNVAGFGALAFLAGGAVYALTVQAPPRALAFGVADVLAATAAVAACVVASLIIAHVRLTLHGRALTPALIGAASLALLYLASVLTVSAFQPSAIETGAALLDLTVRQQGQMLLSGLWGLAGVGALVLGLRRDRRVLRLGALALLLVTAGKVFLYDLSTLDSVYRVASFIALGVLLLLGAYAYQRLRPPRASDLRTVPRALR